MRPIYWVLISLILLPGLVLSNSFEKRIYVTEQITTDPPVIDGLLRDPAWNQVEWESGFIQISPHERSRPSQETAFKVVYDEET